MNGGIDRAIVYPRNAEGDLTINGNIGIIGGTEIDTITIEDALSTQPINYVFSNPFGGGTQNVFGLGTQGGLGTASIENLVVNAGAGADTFDVNQYKSGTALTLNAGGGDDTLNIGNGNLPANITSISAFTFDGQAGFDRFNLNNANENSQWQYIRDSGTIRADRLAPIPGYLVILADANVEEMTVNAGPSVDTFYVRAIAPGTSTILNAGDGLDGLILADSTQNLAGIQGLVRYNAGAGGGNIVVSDNADTTGDTAHLTDTTLGAVPGDDLFGPGGSLEFSNLVNFGAFPGITLNLSSGADTIYAQPLASARVTINGLAPSSAPGDVLNVALSTVQNYVVNGTPASGNVTSDNLQALSYFGFETGPNIDDVAPFIVAQRYDDSVMPTINVQFSEDVSNSLSASHLVLINKTTGETISIARMDLKYDIGTNTASFTFPGYPSGRLPAGDYSAVITGRLPDYFGNEMKLRTPLLFSITPLDAIPPTVRVVSVNPSSRLIPVEQITLVFSEAVTGFDLSDLTFTRTLSSSVSLLPGNAVLHSVDDITWILDGLSVLSTDSGFYQLEVNVANSGITDISGNLMSSGARTSWSMRPGDSNGDRMFNSSDLIAVFQSGEYDDLIPKNSTWAEGDWNGDGDFDSGDLIAAFQSGGYVRAAVDAAMSDFHAADDMRSGRRKLAQPFSTKTMFRQRDATESIRVG